MMKSESEPCDLSSANQDYHGVNLNHEILVPNKALHLTTIPLRSIAAGEL